MNSPYDGLSDDQWVQKTRELIKQHPISTQELYDVVIQSWDSIFQSSIGTKPFRIGHDIFPAPQIMGFLLHELIPLELTFRYPTLWHKGIKATDKDLIYIPNDNFSIEIKTSSSGKNIYGNRSYAQETTTSKKSKSGYYLAVNFEKFSSTIQIPRIALIRFGWLDHTDWMGQFSASGQQARLSPQVEKSKLLILPLSE
ncbi:MAG: ScaI family restriction endonuclease [bacterium]|nr:ScaI family restriction endonuclease [bacterium]